MRAAYLSIAVLLIFPNAADALSAAGHKIIVSIAFRQLSPDEQNRFVAILKYHPRFATDFAEMMPDDIASGTEGAPHEWIFQQASVWPGIVRPPGPPALYRSTWHNINVTHFRDGPSRTELPGSIEPDINLDPADDATHDTDQLNVAQLVQTEYTLCEDGDAKPADRAILPANRCGQFKTRY